MNTSDPVLLQNQTSVVLCAVAGVKWPAASIRLAAKVLRSFLIIDIL